jgi:heptosyltransferase-3
MKIAVVCAPGIGDAVIMHIVSHHLTIAGHQAVTVTPHRFGRWLKDYKFGNEEDCEAIFLQHDNSPKAEKIKRQKKIVYSLYGSHNTAKHGALKDGFDYVCNPKCTMVSNLIEALNTLFQIKANGENGFRPPPELVHRRHLKRVVIHSSSSHPSKNWPEKKFHRVAEWLSFQGFEPFFLPLFPTLEEMISAIYESGYFIGNDSGPGHIASYLQIPNLIIGKDERQMRLWRPGWGFGEIITPPRWIPNWKGFRLREKEWTRFISPKCVITKLKRCVLIN